MGFAWEVTADLGRHDDALDWFGRRTVITAGAARKLDDRLKVEAFWVGGGLQLHQVQSVFDKIAIAIEKGESLEDFKARVVGELRNPAHVETVFRNATQRAYNAGRWAQMKEPSTAKFRPFWMYDTILDSRRTKVCELRHGTLLPQDDPWWDTNLPPLHHRCRSSVRNLRRAEADRRGGIKQPAPDEPGKEPGPGWGQSPAVAAPWKPSLVKVDQQLAFDFEAKAVAGTKKRKPRTKPAKKPTLDTARWTPAYEGRYGAEAAKSLGHGRAALELGLDLPLATVRTELQKLDAPGVKLLLDACEDTDAERTLRDQDGERDPVRKLAAALAGHLHTLPARTAWEHKALAKKPGGKKALDFLGAVTGPNVSLPDDGWKFRTIKRGGDASKAKKLVRYNPNAAGVLEHELGHTLEDLNPELFERAVKFLQARARGESIQTHGKIRGRTVWVWADGFLGKYTGRRYLHDGAFYATEITSTALELLVAERAHWGTLAELARTDFEHLLFLLGQLKGT